MSTLEQIVATIVYFIAGFLLSIPYLFLAGWSWEFWPTTMFFAPAVSFLILTLGIMSGIIRFKRFDKHQGPRIFPPMMFWVVVGYFSLPILLNGMSKIASLFGSEVTAQLIFEQRFASLLIVILVLTLGLALFGAIVSTKEWLQRHFAK